MRILRPGTIFCTALFSLLLTAKAHAGVTSLLITGDPGDYISGGQLLYFTPADGSLTVRANISNGVSVAFNTPSYDHFWYLDFAAPNKQFLAPGVYTNAVRYPYPYIVSSQPGLSVVGDGRGCNTLTGSFEVKEAVYGPSGTMLSFRATFEQHCEGFAPAARGEIRYNATLPIQMYAPTNVSTYERQTASFYVTANDALGDHVSLSTSGLPSGATFVDNGYGGGLFNWTPGEGQAGAYVIAFTGRNSRGDSETVYSRIRVIATPPINDDFGAPVVVGAMPFTYTQLTTLATQAPDDPFCAGSGHTVWYSFTAANDMRVEANTFGSDFDTTLSVYSGTRGALGQIACNDNAKSAQSRVRFDAIAGTTYYFMVGSYYGWPGGHLTLNLLPAPPPLTIGLTLAGFGAVTPSTGDASVVGSIRCSRPVVVTMSGELKQERGQTTIVGRFATAVACDESSDWTAPVIVPLSLFEGRSAQLLTSGPAVLIATAIAVDDESGETVESHSAAPIVLRGR
jgi:putative Ig domain-containing protein